MKRITRKERNTSDAGVYTITNTINGKVYVGSTLNLTTRNSQQVYLLRRNKYNVCNPLTGVSNVKAKTIKVVDMDGNVLRIVRSGVEYQQIFNHTPNYKLIGSGRPQRNKHCLYYI